MLIFRHQVEFDHLAAGRAVVDGVIGDLVARVERHRGIGLADRHRQLDGAAGKVVAADRDRKGRSMNGIGALLGSASGRAVTAFSLVIGVSRE
jgi:hypothetical protein